MLSIVSYPTSSLFKASTLQYLLFIILGRTLALSFNFYITPTQSALPLSRHTIKNIFHYKPHEEIKSHTKFNTSRTCAKI